MELHDRLVLCGQCQGIRPPMEPGQQDCCGPWRGSRSAALCDCCAAAPVPVGGKWASRYCEECRSQIDALGLRDEVPSAVAFMLYSPADPLADGEDPAARIHQDWMRILDQERLLDQWRLWRIEELRRRAGLPLRAEVPLKDYLAVAAQHTDRPAVVTGLSLFMARMPGDPIVDVDTFNDVSAFRRRRRYAPP